MVLKAFGVTLLASLNKRADAAPECADFCPFGTMTVGLEPTKIISERPIRITGYFSSDGPVSLAPGITARVQGAPGVVDTLITFTNTGSSTLTTTLCPVNTGGSSTNGGGQSTDGGTAPTHGQSSDGGAAPTSDGSASPTNGQSSDGGAAPTSDGSASPTNGQSTDGGAASTSDGGSAPTNGQSSDGGAAPTNSQPSDGDAISTSEEGATPTNDQSSAGNTAPTSNSGAASSGQSTDNGAAPTNGQSTTEGGAAPTNEQSTDGSASPTNGQSTDGGAAPTGGQSTEGSAIATSEQSTNSGVAPTDAPTNGQTSDGGGVPTNSPSSDGGNGNPSSTGDGSNGGATSTRGGDGNPSSTGDGGNGNPSSTGDGGNGGATSTGGGDGNPSSTGDGGASPTDGNGGASSTGDGGNGNPSSTGDGGNGSPSSTGDGGNGGATSTGGGDGNPSSSGDGGASTTGGGDGTSSAGQPSSAAPTTAAPTESMQPSSTLPQTSTCVPTFTPVPTICAQTLPAACRDLGNVRGLALIPLVPLCTAAFGVFGGGKVAACLGVNIGLGTDGASIVSCLNAALSDVCISGLPEACTELKDAPLLQLPVKAATCLTALGPFAVGAVTQCLNDVVNGGNAITCLRDSLGLGDPDTPDDGGCPAAGGGQTCLDELPGPCLDLADSNGLDLLPAAARCTLALGRYAGTKILDCIKPSNILPTSTGGGVISCLRSNIASVCLTVLPGSCLNIATTSPANLASQISQCTVDLGPFAGDKATACLDPSTEPQQIVACLTAQLLGVA